MLAELWLSSYEYFLDLDGIRSIREAWPIYALFAYMALQNLSFQISKTVKECLFANVSQECKGVSTIQRMAVLSFWNLLQFAT